MHRRDLTVLGRVRRPAMGFLTAHPMATAVLYVMTGALPLYLTSAQFAALERDLALTASRLGIVTSVYFGVAAAAATPVGRAVQRLGATRGLRIGACVSAAASAVAVASGAWWMLLLATGLAGVANAFMQVSTNVVLARDASYDRQGLSFGAKQGAIPLSSMVAGAMLPVIGVAVGWRWPFAVAGLIAVVASLIAPPVSAAPVTATGDSAGGPWATSTGLRWLAVGGACGGAAGNALSLFLVPSAVDVGISEVRAGTALALGSGLVVVIRLLAGWIADVTGSTGHREMAVALGAGTIGCVALAQVDGPTAFQLAISLALLGSWGWPGLAYFTVVRIHPEAPARASGVLLSGNLTGTLIGPVVVGFLARDGGYGGAWTFCAVLSAVATAAILTSWRATRAQRPGPARGPKGSPADLEEDDMAHTPSHPIDGPGAWVGPDVREDPSWLLRLDASAVAEIDDALRVARSRGASVPFDAAAFPLPTLSATLATIPAALEDGRGFVLVRGLPRERYDDGDCELIFWGIGVHLGTPISQNTRGHLLGHVRDEGRSLDDPTTRAYQTRARMDFHADQLPVDVLGLCCTRTALRGGASTLVSAQTVHNVLQHERPDLVEVLHRPFNLDWRGEEPAGGQPWYTSPMFSWHDGRLTSRITSRLYFQTVTRYGEHLGLTELQREALDAVQEIANRPELRLSMDFREGDMQFLNNHTILHAREAFEDHEDPERKRHLLRMWIALPEERRRKLAPALAERYHLVETGGIPARASA